MVVVVVMMVVVMFRGRVHILHIRVVIGWMSGSDTPLFVRGWLHLNLLNFGAMEVDDDHRFTNSDGN